MSEETNSLLNTSNSLGYTVIEALVVYVDVGGETPGSDLCGDIQVSKVMLCQRVRL